MNDNQIINFILNQCHEIQSRGNNCVDEILRHGNGQEKVKEFLESLRYVADDIERIISK